MLSLLLITHAAALTCHPYQCAPSDLTMEPTQCISYLNQTYFTKPCEDNYYCPQTQPEADASCELIQHDTQKLNPGANCTQNIDCVSNNCLNSHCIGADINQPCESTQDCNPGLYCKDKLCKELLKVKETGCLVDYDCVNNAGCNINEDVGTCLEYFSIEAGDTVSSCENNLNRLCANYRCDGSVCISAVESYITPPVYCSADSSCSSRLDPVTKKFYTGTCECAYSTKGLSYCSLFPGDYFYKQKIYYFDTWYHSDAIQDCHSYDRHSFACMNRTWTEEAYLTVVHYSTWVDNYQLIRDNDNCTQEMFSTDYWEAKLAYDSFDPIPETKRDDSARILAILSLALAMTII
jgi:hypothetical protein